MAVVGSELNSVHKRLHDLRRTVATGMADIGIQPHIIEEILNHRSGHKGGVAGIYNRSSYQNEVRDALLRWSEHVRALVGGERKVIPLRTCSDGVFRNRSRPCLEYQIKRCLGPCCDLITREKYADMVRDAISFLEGKEKTLVRDLKERMKNAQPDQKLGSWRKVLQETLCERARREERIAQSRDRAADAEDQRGLGVRVPSAACGENAGGRTAVSSDPGRAIR